MRSILFLLLCFLPLLGSGKPYSIIVEQPFNAELLDIKQNHDRTISAVGFSNQQKSTTQKAKSHTDAFEYLESVSQTHGVQMHLIKADQNFPTVLLSRVQKLNRFNKAVALVKTPDDGYFVGGYTVDGELLLAKLDRDGERIYIKTFGTKNFDFMSSLVALSDGGVLAVGSSFTTRNPYEKQFTTGLGIGDIYLVRFSKDGRELWSKKLGSKYDDKGVDAVEANDGSIIVAGVTTNGENRDVTLMRTTENGDKIWLKQFSSTNRLKPTKLIRLRDNSFITSVIEYNSLEQEHIRLIKFDLHKNILIDKNIFTTYPSGLNDLQEFSDGTIMGVGYVKDGANTDALAMLLDSGLSMLRQDHFGADNYDTFKALTILNNSEVAVAGIHTENDSQETNMWITKLYRDTSLAMGKQRSNATNEPIEKKEQVKQKNNFASNPFETKGWTPGFIELQDKEEQQPSKNSAPNSLYKLLCKLFAAEIKNKELAIEKDLSIDLLMPEIYFQVASYTLNQKQKELIVNFGSKLIPFLQVHKKQVKQLQINGHASSEWAKDNYTTRYLKNEKLSMQRAYSVFETLFKSQDLKTQKYFETIIVGSGYSSSKKRIIEGKEDKDLSRRVSFKIFEK